jgi:phage terminase large subunit-like protein
VPPARAPLPWWGDGADPCLRWPGVIVTIPTTWSKERGRWEAPDARYYFDVAAADRVCEFFPALLKHHIGEFAGRPFELSDYQRVLVRAVFGWKRTSDDTRRFRKVLLFVGKGGGKSPLGSGLGLYLARCDDEPGAEVYAVASDREQGKVVHETAKIMVEQSEELLEQCEVLRDALYFPETRSVYKVLSADAAGKHGVRPHGIIFDELHAQPNRDLFEALERSMGKRRQPLFLMLSHAGDDDEGICYEEYEYAKRLLSGTIEDETYFPMIFEADPKDDWTIEATWRKANPTLGVTVKRDALETACRAAQNEPRKRNDFLRYHLNRWVGQAVAWLPVEWWDACPALPINDAEVQGLPCAMGLDMAQKIDLSAFAVVFQLPLAGKAQKLEVLAEDEQGELVMRDLSLNYQVRALVHFWLPEDTMREREKEGRIPYGQWAAQGLLTVTDGGAIDYDRIYQDITKKIAPRFPLMREGLLGYDPAFATDIANRLRDRAGFKTFEVLQNYKHFSEVCQVFEALVKTGRVIHDGNRVLRWNVENVAVKRDDAGRIRPVKPKGAKKIDGVVATMMALKALMAWEQPVASEYERRAAANRALDEAGADGPRQELIESW